ncbi:hypothetical protein [Winogradskyella poriferorum]|uniref:Uncharacterized protein n=1 Tax=Winogradskyella poriferorum TaxID=307627 RepID=A0ABU7W6G6_9FLAO
MHQIQNNQGEFSSISNLIEYIMKTCANHFKEKRALAFALIVYDFEDPQVIEILQNQKYFDALDYISGDKLTVFYINSQYLDYQSKVASESNLMHIELGVQKIGGPVNVSPKIIAENLINKENLPSPSVLFFTVSENVITNFTIAQLRHQEVEKGFIELKEIIKNGVGSLDKVQDDYKENKPEIFNLIKGSIEASEFWKNGAIGFNKLMKIKSFISFWKV